MSIANSFKNLKPNYKEAYSDQKPDRFKRTRSMIAPKGKATAEAKASANPMKALKDKSYLNLKGKKGVAV